MAARAQAQTVLSWACDMLHSLLQPRTNSESNAGMRRHSSAPQAPQGTRRPERQLPLHSNSPMQGSFSATGNERRRLGWCPAPHKRVGATHACTQHTALGGAASASTPRKYQHKNNVQQVMPGRAPASHSSRSQHRPQRQTSSMHPVLPARGAALACHAKLTTMPTTSSGPLAPSLLQPWWCQAVVVSGSMAVLTP